MAPVKTRPVKKAIKTNKVAAKKAAMKRVAKRVTVPQTGFKVEVFEALLASRPFEPEWMHDRRRDAFHVLLDTPLPRRTDEAWRRTDIGALKLDEVEVIMPQPVVKRPSKARRARSKRRSPAKARRVRSCLRTGRSSRRHWMRR